VIYTVADARAFCAAYVDGGREESDPKVLDRLNESEMLLLREAKSIDFKRVARFYVDAGKTLPMPEMVESVLRVNFNGVAGSVRGMGYEFLSSGPGPEMDHTGGITGEDLKDLGDQYPTFYPIGVTPQRIIAVSDDSRDLGLQIRLRGWDAFNTEISPSTPGEMLQISAWQGGEVGVLDYTHLRVSANDFQQLTSIVKPVTYGHVSLYAYDPDTHDLWFLSRYAPHETQPGYRRYAVMNKACIGDCYIHALVKIRHVPLRNESDPMTIQDLMALRYMCQSLHKQQEGDVKAGMTFQTLAVRSVSKQSENKSTDDMIIDFDVAMGPGSIPEI